MRAAAALFFAVLTAAATGVSTAEAGLLGCGNQTFRQVFRPWGDLAQYTLAPGGSFESGSGWGLGGGARIVGGNNPFFLNSPTDRSSLLLPPGSSATSPAVCLQTLSPKVRLVGYSSDGSAVRVSTYTRSILGLVPLGISAEIQLGQTWDASEEQQILLQNVLALTALGTQNVVFRFTPVGTATVQLDDFFVDPLLNW